MGTRSSFTRDQEEGEFLHALRPVDRHDLTGGGPALWKRLDNRWIAGDDGRYDQALSFNGCS